MVIYTIGHSTRSLDELVELLRAHHVSRLADIRTVPRSRRHPHFSADALAVSLPALGVGYRHFPGLGGLRKPRKDSQNGAWRHEGFRGYADYMETAAFRDALTALIEWGDAGAELPATSLGPGRGLHTAIMCAEAVWWRCHRRLVTDYLLARGWEVTHLMAPGQQQAGVLTPGAVVHGDGTIEYPAAEGQASLPM